MDPCPYVRILVGNLALKIPPPSPARPASGSSGGVHPSAAPCYAKIRLNGSGSGICTASVPLVSTETELPATPSAGLPAAIAAGFHVSAGEILKIAGKGTGFWGRRGGKMRLKVEIFTGSFGASCSASGGGRRVGRVNVELELRAAVEGKAAVLWNGWVRMRGKMELFLTVKAEAEPRFVFEFEGAPESGAQVVQVGGTMRQPMFTCKFGCRSGGDWHTRSRSVPLETTTSRSWLTFNSERGRTMKERKGWSVTVHDLTGSPVALASMVTPFVASPGTDRVSRSNPGAWLVLRPGDGTWKPWGRLEAWRERSGGGNSLGYKFELLLDSTMSAGITIAEDTISATSGGKFSIDLTGKTSNPLPRSTSPGHSPRGSGDFGYSLWPFSLYRGFVMSSTVAGEGRSSKPVVEVGAQHVGCAEDAAAFVALAAAIDLSMDACKLFSHKLRKGLSNLNF